MELKKTKKIETIQYSKVEQNWIRYWAFMLDVLLINCVLGGIGYAINLNSMPVINFVLCGAVYVAYFVIWKEETFGQRILSIGSSNVNGNYKILTKVLFVAGISNIVLSILLSPFLLYAANHFIKKNSMPYEQPDFSFVAYKKWNVEKMNIICSSILNSITALIFISTTFLTQMFMDMFAGEFSKVGITLAFITQSIQMAAAVGVVSAIGVQYKLISKPLSFLNLMWLQVPWLMGFLVFAVMFVNGITGMQGNFGGIMPQ